MSRRGCSSAVMLAAMLAGCAASGPRVPADSIYQGAGFHDTWEWGPVYREPPIVIGPPGRSGSPIAPSARPAPTSGSK